MHIDLLAVHKCLWTKQKARIIVPDDAEKHVQWDVQYLLGGFACMKVQRRSAGRLLVIAASVLAFACCGDLAAETRTNSNAPTGLYVSLTDMPFTLVVRLGTNGDYQVHYGCPAPIGDTQTSTPMASQQGHWKWDARRQEFLLTPMTNTASFLFEFRRLRVAPHESDTLQWVPLNGGGGGGSGVIDYIRFKRKNE